MKSTRLTVALAAIVIALSASPASAATLANAFISGKGVDAADCGPVAKPCRTLQYVHDTIVSAGGVVSVLDGAEYGPVVIRKAIGIINDGAGVAYVSGGSSANAVSIFAGASDSVLLRGLTIEGPGTASYGVALYTGGALTIEKSSIRHFNTGVYLAPNGATRLVVTDTVLSDNVGGLTVAGNQPGTAQGVIARVTAVNNSFAGVYIASVGSAAGSAVASNFTVVDSVFEGNDSGVVIRDPGTVTTLGRNVIDGNRQGVNILFGGIAYSYGDNKINANAGGDIAGGGALLALSAR